MKLRVTLSVLAVAALLTGPSAGLPIAAAAEDDPSLQQKLGDLAIVHGERVLETGHIDMGPKFDDGTWTFLIHDDVAKADADATSVWRYPDETVFRVLDQGKLEIPDDPAYSFIGAEPGSPVWVVPQTQNLELVWLGWNTQDPEVMKTIDRGITMSLTGVQGPGIVNVYLQSGTFGEPQVLWDSRKPETQPVWVDVNTHTHANWTFTEPGVYLVRVRAEADLLDGTHASDTQLLRFAVGTDTSTAEAMTATWQGVEEQTGTPGESEQAGTNDTEGTGQNVEDNESSSLVPILVGAIVLVALALIAGFAVAILRGDRARKQVLAGHGARASGEDAGSSPAEVDRDAR